jgi:hypothetical protein
MTWVILLAKLVPQEILIMQVVLTEAVQINKIPRCFTEVYCLGI